MADCHIRTCFIYVNPLFNYIKTMKIFKTLIMMESPNGTIHMWDVYTQCEQIDLIPSILAHPTIEKHHEEMRRGHIHLTAISTSEVFKTHELN